MLSRIFGAVRVSQQLLQLNVDRVRFLMEYLQQHALKNKHAVVESLNRELLLSIPEGLRDPEGRIWPDPSNKNLAISFNCNDSTHPNRVDQFVIRGFEQLANTSIFGSAHEPYDGKLMWSVDIESRFSKVPPLARALEKAIYQMPGWKVIGFDNIRFVQQQ